MKPVIYPYPVTCRNGHIPTKSSAKRCTQCKLIQEKTA